MAQRLGSLDRFRTPPIALTSHDPSRWDFGRPWIQALNSGDPTGAMRARLDEVGAYADGCQDVGDAAKATAAEMQALGIPAELVALADGTTTAGGGGHVKSLGTADLATLAQTVLNAAGAAAAP